MTSLLVSLTVLFLVGTHYLAYQFGKFMREEERRGHQQMVERVRREMEER